MLDEEKFLNSIRSIIRACEFVSINYQGINAYVRNFFPTNKSHWSKIYPLGYRRRRNNNDELDFLFIIGSLAFCFWGFPKKWTIVYKNKKLDGWWAYVASCERALESGLQLLEGEYLSGLSLDETREIFAGEPEIPLLAKRKEILNKIGKTLVEKYDGRFHVFYQRQPQEALSLIEKIANEFYGFDDVALYHGTKVLFYKKAQVVLTDIFEIFLGQGYGKIKNIDKLHGHADYKIPAFISTII